MCPMQEIQQKTILVPSAAALTSESCQGRTTILLYCNWFCWTALCQDIWKSREQENMDLTIHMLCYMSHAPRCAQCLLTPLFEAWRSLCKERTSTQVSFQQWKTFKAVAKTIESTVTHPDVKRYLTSVLSNLEKAPWWGGILERLIKSTKKYWRKKCWPGKVSYDELLTAVTEMEAILNSGPLSYVSADDLESHWYPHNWWSVRDCSDKPRRQWQWIWDWSN